MDDKRMPYEYRPIGINASTLSSSTSTSSSSSSPTTITATAGTGNNNNNNIDFNFYHRSSPSSYFAGPSTLWSSTPIPPLKRMGLRYRLLILLFITLSGTLMIMTVFPKLFSRTIKENTFISSGSFQGPIICPIPSPAPFNESIDPASFSSGNNKNDKKNNNNNIYYQANQAYQLGSLDRDEYYEELVRFFPAREENLRYFLQPSIPPLNITGAPPSPIADFHQIPPLIWQTAAEPLSQVEDPVELARAHSWVSQTGVQVYDPARNVWDNAGSWKYHRLTDPEIYDMWPKNFLKLWDIVSYRPVILADTWRLLSLVLKGGVYADIDTELIKPITKWWTDAQFGACDSNYTAPSLIVSMERDNLFAKKPWYTIHARPVQIVQWAFASAPGHPVMVDALRRVYKNLDDHLQNNSIETLKDLGSTDLLRLTGPGPFTDAVLRYLAVQHDIHWWDLQQLGQNTATSAMQFGEVLFLPRMGFNPTTIMKRKYMPLHQSVCLDHNFAGSWRN